MNRSLDPADPIASRRNPLIRRIARLDRDSAARREEGVFLIWGGKAVEEALQDPSRVERLVIGSLKVRQAMARPLLRRARQASLPVTAVEERLLNDLLPGAGDQGLLAMVRIRVVSPDAMISGRRDPLLLVVDRVQDPGNLGTLVRLGEAAGISGLLTVPGTVDPYHTRAARASSGSILRVPVGRIAHAGEFAAWCRLRGVRILVTVPADGLPCHRAQLSGAVALVAGHEGEGVAGEWLRVADGRLTVSLGGSVQSLNVSLATAIVLYEASRQRAP